LAAARAVSDGWRGARRRSARARASAGRSSARAICDEQLELVGQLRGGRGRRLARGWRGRARCGRGPTCGRRGRGRCGRALQRRRERGVVLALRARAGGEHALGVAGGRGVVAELVRHAGEVEDRDEGVGVVGAVDGLPQGDGGGEPGAGGGAVALLVVGAGLVVGDEAEVRVVRAERGRRGSRGRAGRGRGPRGSGAGMLRIIARSLRASASSGRGGVAEGLEHGGRGGQAVRRVVRCRARGWPRRRPAARARAPCGRCRRGARRARGPATRARRAAGPGRPRTGDGAQPGGQGGEAELVGADRLGERGGGGQVVGGRGDARELEADERALDAGLGDQRRVGEGLASATSGASRPSTSV
jgi:hypothetical protein